MHQSVMDYIALAAAGDEVLEVGSLDVNGSPRALFPAASRYIGLDMRPGPGVDVVGMASELANWTPAQFDVALYCETIEHDLTPWLSLAGMARVLRPGGLLVVTGRGIDHAYCDECSHGRPHAFGMHGEPNDYWRLTPETLPALLPLFGFRVLDHRPDPQAPGYFATAIIREGATP